MYDQVGPHIRWTVLGILVQQYNVVWDFALKSLPFEYSFLLLDILDMHSMQSLSLNQNKTKDASSVS